jgi:UDP-N-acetylmuramyl tripeptide synthase
MRWSRNACARASSTWRRLPTSGDHLDYHATWEEYLEAKARLISLTASSADKGIEKTAVLNRDDVSFERLAGKPISRRWTYGMTTAADLHPLDIAITGAGSHFRLHTPMGETEVTLNVPAKFNIYNALCAAGVCLALGVPVENIGRGLAGFGAYVAGSSRSTWARTLVSTSTSRTPLVRWRARSRS